MSDGDRRPRRIIASADMPAAPPPQPQPALLLQQRFQRALSAWPLPRRWSGAPQTKVTVTQPEPEAAPPRPQPARDAAAVVATAKGNAPREAPRQRRANASRDVSARSLPMPEMPQQPDLLSQPDAWRLAGLQAPAPEGWDVDLAGRIVHLLRRADPAFQSWSITVPLDPRVLPDTELHMALSLQRLALRFQTQSPYSLALVSRHRQRLVALLEQALPSQLDIDIETS